MKIEYGAEKSKMDPTIVLTYLARFELGAVQSLAVDITPEQARDYAAKLLAAAA